MSATHEWATWLGCEPSDAARELDRLFRALVEARGVLTTLERASAVLPVRPSNVWEDIDSLADAVYVALTAVQREGLS